VLTYTYLIFRIWIAMCWYAGAARKIFLPLRIAASQESTFLGLNLPAAPYTEYLLSLFWLDCSSSTGPFKLPPSFTNSHLYRNVAIWMAKINSATLWIFHNIYTVRPHNLNLRCMAPWRVSVVVPTYINIPLFPVFHDLVFLWSYGGCGYTGIICYLVV
jgi:hypothetical protein